MKYLSIVLTLFLSLNLSAESNRWEGQPFAKFSLNDQHGKSLNNNDFSSSWVVYYFYPKDRTPGCTVEAQNFVNDYSAFEELSVKIVGISYDDTESHKDFADTYEMKFTLLADVDHALSKAMDVNQYLPWPHPSRETFIVNPDGKIMKHYADVDPKSHSKELLKELAVLQSKTK